MEFIQQLKEKCKSLKKKIVLPESYDERVLNAASKLRKENILEPILIGDKIKINKISNDKSISIDDIEIIDPNTYSEKENYIQEYYELRKHKNISLDKARECLDDPLIFSGFLVRNDKADGCVAGAVNSTANVIRTGITVIGCRPNVKTVSSFFIMILPKKEFGYNGILFYADGSVIPYPTEEQLIDITICTADSFKSLTNVQPRVAMLSFSTKGSAEHKNIDKIRAAVKQVKELVPELIVDGELQADTALIPAIAKKKAPDSMIQGDANVMIFPNLDAGNIAYKLTERLADAAAVGPFVQGLNKPYNDLSRGCSADDIYATSIITALQ